MAFDSSLGVVMSSCSSKYSRPRLATSAGAEFFGEKPGFAPGNALHALVLDDSRLLQPHPLTPEERLERCLYHRQRDAIRAVWSAGRRVR